jgi:hypothetical protein
MPDGRPQRAAPARCGSSSNGGVNWYVESIDEGRQDDGEPK